jgi:hypothetical protein
MNDDVDMRQPAESTSVFVLYAALTSERPPAPEREPPNQPKKPPIDEPPLRVPDRSDPEDPPPAGDPPPKRPPSKLRALPHLLHQLVRALSVRAGEYTRVVS